MDDRTSALLAFDQNDPSLGPVEQQVSTRSAFYLPANIDEHPEVLPMAHDIAMEQLTSVQDDYDVPMGIASLRESRLTHAA